MAFVLAGCSSKYQVDSGHDELISQEDSSPTRARNIEALAVKQKLFDNFAATCKRLEISDAFNLEACIKKSAQKEQFRLFAQKSERNQASLKGLMPIQTITTPAKNSNLLIQLLEEIMSGSFNDIVILEIDNIKSKSSPLAQINYLQAQKNRDTYLRELRLREQRRYKDEQAQQKDTHESKDSN
ncbi:MAG: hypothetical protein ABR63_06790 [SAR86 cluster bacterium BACL1 MAG-120920-bin57]|uniref:Uncharacterized protein n=2 Tax=SAR86 cluster TaxID=62672 RepID=A0A0R2U8W1_9GAMM|nr:MAG: hypothetical protein ABR59_07430 [SAR86 cluster bacterium BACL1 MAG-120507-bin14]KRO37995.1 MAG: hypothetical protein ABR63_06790 [SAR86 cluster bacterium BACL1 MAG-120920-bin57]KRO95964.1 MAG: hypothetical protein ABS10_05325 [SAR86 cluster bacterium BACL1 MAG-120820-bin45]KRO97643.1 MAG: hypothetical protein ABS11_02755 [SAR86 cluster bacterium BACL1 MAG-120828-bin5]KRO97756.1 MAG: hypothetical protein ABS15_02175 [SAR86 cluster bacterium BACL1 MAG-120823-bin87]KRP15503.1 MAG: hypoth